MNRYQPSSAPQRTAFATLAFVATLATLGSIGGLVEHYAGSPQAGEVEALAMSAQTVPVSAARVR